MFNDVFDPIYAGSGSFSVCGCFGEDEAKAMEECIKKRQDEYDFAMDAREDALKDAVLNGTSYNDYFNIKTEQPQFGSDSQKELIELFGSGLENIALNKDLLMNQLIKSANIMTLDLNGHKLSRYVKNFTQSAPVIYATAGVLTIKGDGEIVTEGTEDDRYGICIWCGSADAKVVIEDGKFYGGCWKSDRRDLNCSPTIYVTKGVIEITGGEFKGGFGKALGTTVWEDGSVKPGSYCVLNCLDSAYKSGEAKIIVKGGRFFNFNPIACGSDDYLMSYVADGYTVKVDGKEDLERWSFGKGDRWYSVVKK